MKVEVKNLALKIKLNLHIQNFLNISRKGKKPQRPGEHTRGGCVCARGGGGGGGGER